MTCQIDPFAPETPQALPLTMPQFLCYRPAITFARRAHEGQKRADGRAYFSHPFAVFQILRSAAVDLPESAYVAALLHDTLEDGRTRAEEITTAFGQEVEDAVQALTRPAKSNGSCDSKREEEYLRQMIAAHERLPYLLHVKMADRLHNLETAHFLPPERQSALRQVTATLYLPILQAQEMKQPCYTEGYRCLLGMIERSVTSQTGPAAPLHSPLG